MSLSFWLRDYVYIPLGGSCATAKLVNGRNLFITMVACGLWGMALPGHYVVFGCLQGFGLIVQREWRDFLRSVNSLNALGKTAPIQWCSVLLTDLFVIVTFTIFRAPDIPTGLNVLLPPGSVRIPLATFGCP